MFCLLGIIFYYYGFNFITDNWPVHVFYFLWFTFGRLDICQEFVHFFYIVHLIGLQLFVVISSDPSYFCSFCYKFSVFIFDFIYLVPLSFIFLRSLAKGLSVGYDCLGQYGHFNNINPSNLRTWYIFPSACVLFSFFHQCLIVF